MIERCKNQVTSIDWVVGVVLKRNHFKFFQVSTERAESVCTSRMMDIMNMADVSEQPLKQEMKVTERRMA